MEGDMRLLHAALSDEQHRQALLKSYYGALPFSPVPLDSMQPQPVLPGELQQPH